MVDLDEFAAEVAQDLMLDWARRPDRLAVRNTVGGHESLADLDDDGVEAFYAAVLERIENADIDIHMPGG